jgi:hypothetical protein
VDRTGPFFLVKIVFPVSRLLIVPLLFCSCRSVRENLNVQVEKVDSVYEKSLAEYGNKKSKKLNWDMALDLMLKNNLELKRARDSLDRAIENRAQIYWDLVPSLGLSANLSKSLTDLGDLSSRDIRFNVFSAINFPGLISLYSRRYASLLGVIVAEWNLKLKGRELIIRLRELFLEYADFEMRKGIVAKGQLWSSSKTRKLSELIDSTPEEILLEQQAFNLRISENQLSLSLAKMLGNFDYRWELVQEGLPELSYAEKPLDLTRKDKVGVLLRQKQAANLEALRLREVTAKLSYFPDLNLGLSSPSLYRVSNKTATGFSVDDMIVRLGSSVSFDTNLRRSRQLKDIRREIEFQNRFMKDEIRAQIQKAFLAQQELSLVVSELDLANLRLTSLDAQPRSSDLNEMRVYLEKRFVLLERLSSLQLKKARIEGGFWLLDDDKWRK